MPVSIRSRLLLLVLSVLVPGVAAALWIITETYQSERLALERNLSDTTRALSMVVDRELAQRASIARALSLSRHLDDAPAVSPEQLARFEQQARQAMDGLGGWVTLRSADSELLDTRRSGDATVPTAPDAPAAVSASSRTAAPGAWADSARIGPLERSADGDELRASAVQPVQRGGRTVLNLAVMLRPAELQSMIDRQRLSPDWRAEVIDSRGTVVAHHPGGIAHAGRLASNDFGDLGAKLAPGREEGFDSVSPDGNAVSVYLSTTPQGWTFVSAMPRLQLVGWMPWAVQKVVLGALLLLGAAVGGALWVARRIAQPVQTLKQAAAQMQAGEPVQPHVTGLVECDEVAAALVSASDAMRDARSELEREVAQAVRRTREAEHRLSRSQRVEALGRLTGGVAHDFNNLLGVISNSAYLIQRQASGADLQVPVTATLRAVAIGSRLTQQLLRFAGQQAVNPQAVELGRFLPDARELVQTVLGSRIEVTVAVAPNTPRVTIDTNELELALTNLALNARDAMPSGGHLTVQARPAHEDEVPDLPPGDYVLITVSDDGVGIDDAHAEHVFEPFFTTKAVGQGTGLSLSQVLGFCVQAGGTARLTSTEGLGTTVSLLLPARSEAAAIEAAPAAAAATLPPTPSIDGARLLLVEDNDELAEVTAVLLGAMGCTVQRAPDPQGALRLIAVEPAFDVVLSDIVMPGGMDGLGLARVLRDCCPDLPVVLISGYTAQTAAANADDFVVLSKPCQPTHLLNALHEAMAGTAAHR